jgi:hypothetical protein
MYSVYNITFDTPHMSFETVGNDFELYENRPGKLETV